MEVDGLMDKARSTTLNVFRLKAVPESGGKILSKFLVDDRGTKNIIYGMYRGNMPTLKYIHQYRVVLGSDNRETYI